MARKLKDAATAALDRREAGLGLHYTNLYDQDHDEAGEHYDLSTGRRYDNSTFTVLDELTIVLEDWLENYDPD